MDIARWALGVNRLSDAVISYGGRVGYEDAGETPNTQSPSSPTVKQSLVFEVRGLETGPTRAATVGNIIEGTEGYVVIAAAPHHRVRQEREARPDVQQRRRHRSLCQLHPASARGTPGS